MHFPHLLIIVFCTLAWPITSSLAAATSSGRPDIPRWAARLSAGQWYEIPDTAPSRIGRPFPDQRGRQASRLAYSGSTLRRSGSYLFIFGGGHADYSGNEIHAIKLNAEQPTWELLSPATPFSQIPWKSRERGKSHYADGRPASRHTYWQPIFVDSMDRMFLFLSMVVWGNSSGSFKNVDAFRFSDRAWDPKDTWAPPPVFPPAATGPWAVKHPDTEDVYIAIYSSVLKWTRSTGEWSFHIRGASWEHDRGIAAIDPVRQRILKLGSWNRGHVVVPYFIPLDEHDTMTFINLTGSHANVIASTSTGTVGQAGFVYNPELDKFMYYPDDGAIYTIDPVTWHMVRYPVTGNVPPAGIRYSAENGSGIYGRFQYVPELRGVVYMPTWTKNLFFLKTGEPRR